MASLGFYLLLTAFVMCAYAMAASVAGARRLSEEKVRAALKTLVECDESIKSGRAASERLAVEHWLVGV